MKKELVFHDDSSPHTFWHIEVTGSAYTVTYGEVGNKGQRKTTLCDNAEKALEEARKAIVVRKNTDYLARQQLPQNFISNDMKMWTNVVKAKNFDDKKLVPIKKLDETGLILEGLHDPDPLKVEEALVKMIAWSKNCSHSAHPLCKLFNVRGVNINIPLLSSAIKHPDLPSGLLADIVELTLGSDTTSFKLLNDVIKILIKRKDIDAQIKVCNAFSKALNETGTSENISKLRYKFSLLFQFRPEALVELLPRINDKVLISYTCRSRPINSIFSISLVTGNENIRQIVIDSLKSHMEYCIKENWNCAKLLGDIRDIDSTILVELDSIQGFSESFLKWEFEYSLSSKNESPVRVLNILNELNANPIKVDIDKVPVSLSRIYEALHRNADWKGIAEISDKFLKLDDHIVWSQENRQYPLTYLVVSAIDMQEGGRQYFENHVRPWIKDGIFDCRLAYKIASFWAKNKEYKEMVKAIQRATELGTSAKQFINDSDFTDAINSKDPELLGVLGLG